MKDADWVAHRGYPLRYPENTRIGLQAAIDAGARWIETDVQLSADGVPILFHDRRLRRVCGVDGAIHERTVEELGRLRAAEPDYFGRRFAGTPLATLQDLVDLLREHPWVECFVELKSVAAERFGVEAAVEAVARYILPLRDRCVLISFDSRVPSAARRAGVARTGWIAERWEDVLEPPAEASDVDHLLCNAAKIPPGPLPAANLDLTLYDVIDREVAEGLMGRGARRIETFDIGAMLGGFRRHGRDPADG